MVETVQSERLIRKASSEDVGRIMEIIAMAAAFMKAQNIKQWCDGYPGREHILSDIARGESYVCVQDGRIMGTAALSLREEPSYSKIYEGRWITSGRYGVIHRIAVDNRKKRCGIAGAFVDDIEKMCISKAIHAVRVDTHCDNRPMRSFLEKRGFVCCGVIYLPGGDSRVAYEKRI